MKKFYSKTIVCIFLLFCYNLTSLTAQTVYDWNWNLDSINFELPCDSLIELECNGTLIEFSICNIDWAVVEDCIFGLDTDDWDWDLDSLDFDDWGYDDWDWDWDLDSLDFDDWGYDDWDWDLDSLDFDDWGYDDWDWDWDLDSIDFDEWSWDLDSIDLGFDCDSLFEFECQGEPIEISVCDIDWDALIDCFSDLDEEDAENDENGEDGEGGLAQPASSDNDIQTAPTEDKEEYYNPNIGEIFPNPFVDHLNVNIITYEGGLIEFSLIDVKGGIVHQEEADLPAGGGKYVWPINLDNKLHRGMYLLNVTNAQQQIIKSQNLIVVD